MLPALMAFLQALPLLVKELSDIRAEIRGLREVAQSDYVVKLKNEMAEKVNAVSKAQTNDDFRKALSAIYPLLTKQ